MKAYVMYESKTGNTKKLADTIKKYYRDRDCTALGLDDADVVFEGSWTDKGHIADAMAEKVSRLKEKKVFIFGTCGYASDEYYKQVAEMSARALTSGSKMIGYFYCQGEMPISVRQKYEASLSENAEDIHMQVALENFDMAIGHPNQDDLDRLVKVLDELKA